MRVTKPVNLTLIRHILHLAVAPCDFPRQGSRCRLPHHQLTNGLATHRVKYISQDNTRAKTGESSLIPARQSLCGRTRDSLTSLPPRLSTAASRTNFLTARYTPEKVLIRARDQYTRP